MMLDQFLLIVFVHENKLNNNFQFLKQLYLYIFDLLREVDRESVAKTIKQITIKTNK